MGVVAPVGEFERVGVVVGLIMDGLGVNVVEEVHIGEEVAPTPNALILTKSLPGLEPTEDTEAVAPFEHTKLLSWPILEGCRLRYVTTASKT
jgi:hypothetical protein